MELCRRWALGIRPRPGGAGQLHPVGAGARGHRIVQSVEPDLHHRGRSVRCALPQRRAGPDDAPGELRSEEHTSELQSLMRISYAVFCLKKKITTYTRVYKDKNK